MTDIKPISDEELHHLDHAAAEHIAEHEDVILGGDEYLALRERLRLAEEDLTRTRRDYEDLWKVRDDLLREKADLVERANRSEWKLGLAEAVVEASSWLEDAFDIRNTPSQAPAERKLARALAEYRRATGRDRGHEKA